MKFETYAAVQMNLFAPSYCNQAVDSSRTLELDPNYMASHFRRPDITVLCIGMISLFFPWSSECVLKDFLNTQSLFP